MNRKTGKMSYAWSLIAALAAMIAVGAWTPPPAAAQISRSAVDQQIQSKLQNQFQHNKDLRNVHANVSDRVVTLTGSVPSYRAKLNAQHDALQTDNVNGFVNRLRVEGPTVADSQLKKELATRLTYDRIGLGQTFNSINLKVNHGYVTLSGEVRDYPDRDSAIDIAADTKGVKGVTDNIKVAPLSPMDDQIRLEAAQRIYGNPAMEKYAIDPAHPIRILVNNGHVTLAGVVNSNVDKQIAGNAVRTMPNVFSVKNDLVVAH